MKTTVIMFNLDFPGIYQRYKSGTAKAVNWLFETAVKCVYQPANVDDTAEKKSKQSK